MDKKIYIIGLLVDELKDQVTEKDYANDRLKTSKSIISSGEQENKKQGNEIGRLRGEVNLLTNNIKQRNKVLNELENRILEVIIERDNAEFKASKLNIEKLLILSLVNGNPNMKCEEAAEIYKEEITTARHKIAVKKAQSAKRRKATRNES